MIKMTCCRNVFPYLSCSKILWSIPYGWLQWLLILIAMSVSGSVLVITFWPAVRDDTKTTAFAIIVAIVLLHALLAIGCKVIYFIYETILFILYNIYIYLSHTDYYLYEF